MIDPMKPGWVITKAGGVRYDGTHYCIEAISENHSEIIVFPSGSSQGEVIQFTYPECSKYAMHNVDQAFPPKKWRYLGSARHPRTSQSWKKEDGYQIITQPFYSPLILVPSSTLLYRTELSLRDSKAYEMPPSPYLADVFRLIDSGEDMFYRFNPRAASTWIGWTADHRTHFTPWEQ